MNFKKFDSFHNDLLIAKELLYDKCDFVLSELKAEDESVEYGACTFRINGISIKFRVSKITPTKTGQFVTIWKRNLNGITEPFNDTDDLDVVVISARNENNFGQFVFTKSLLVEHGIISNGDKDGKRGIRVYPPWDKATNKQAEKTQNWQRNYFVAIKNDNSTDFNLAKKLFRKRHES